MYDEKQICFVTELQTVVSFKKYYNNWCLLGTVNATRLLLNKLHGPSMLPDKAKFVECSIISLALSFWMKHLVIGQL